MNMPLRPVPVTSWPVTEGGHPATLIAALARNAAQSGGRAAFRERDRGVWQEQSWADTFTEVMALAAALEALGLGPGDARGAVTRIGRQFIGRNIWKDRRRKGAQCHCGK